MRYGSTIANDAVPEFPTPTARSLREHATILGSEVDSQNMANSRSCMYCAGDLIGTATNEHVVPKAIGGRATIRGVCKTCNNQVLSHLDNNLCTKSPLGLVASHCLRKRFAEYWDVAEGLDNLLLEATPSSDGQSSHLYPQLVIEDSGICVWGNLDDIRRFGEDAFQGVLFKMMRNAYDRHKSGAKELLHHNAMLPSAVPKGHRLPPRIFTRNSIAQLMTNPHGRFSFETRYSRKSDRVAIEKLLSTLSPNSRGTRFEMRPGSLTPIVGGSINLTLMVRGLLKIGVNLIAYACRRTQVSSASFGPAIRAVIGADPLNSVAIVSTGFVCPDSLTLIHDEAGAHRFLLQHHSSQWSVYMSFFGGLGCAVARLPGPCDEQWNSCTIVAPIDSGNWERIESPIVYPIIASVRTHDFHKLFPKLPLTAIKVRIVNGDP